jgi:hypothetical protein
MPEQYTQHLAEPCLQCGRRRQYDRPYLAQRSKFCSRACHMAYRKANAIPVVERFWKYVDKDGPVPSHRPDLGPCWLWTGATTRHGYGKIGVPGYHGRTERASRVSWELQYGPIPDGLWALHHCDNPPCVRPDHLFLGTVGDNHEDMIGKVRGTQGERQWLAKLTEADVRAIRLTYASGSVAINQIAREHGVGRSTIQAIVHRRTWKHVA